MKSKAEILEIDGPQKERNKEILKRISKTFETELPQGNPIKLRAHSMYSKLFMEDGTFGSGYDGMELHLIDIDFIAYTAKQKGYTVDTVFNKYNIKFYIIY